MARLTGDAMTEVAQEELSQIPLISRLAATTNILTLPPPPPQNTAERAAEVVKERMKKKAKEETTSIPHIYHNVTFRRNETYYIFVDQMGLDEMGI